MSRRQTGSTKVKLLIAGLLVVLLIGVTSVLSKNSNSMQVQINQTTYNLEVATTPSQQATGLMYRTEMASNQGMLFIFDSAQVRAFYMKNTLIPLDIIFLDQNKSVLNIAKNVPPCQQVVQDQSDCPLYYSQGAAKYVIELNAGQTDKINLQPGQIVNLEL